MLKAIRLINCQSLEDVNFELASDKLNVLVAENNTGKSVLFKMLKATASPTYHTREELNNLIRTGADYAMAVFQFDDGCVGATIITPKQIMYKFKCPEDSDFSAYLTPPKEFLDHVGLVTNGDDFVANIIDTDQDMLLINSNLKGNGELIRLIAENSTLNELGDKCTELTAEFRGYSSKISSYLSALNVQLNQLSYEDATSLEQSIDRETLYADTCEQLCSVFNYVTCIQASLKDRTDYDSMLVASNVAVKLGKVVDLLNKIQFVKMPDEKYEGIITKLSSLQSVCSRLNLAPDRDYSLLEPLEKLKALQLSLTKLVIDSYDYEEVLQLVLAGIKIDSLVAQLSTIEESINVGVALNSSIDLVRASMRECGEVVECPIHGEVVFNGEECVPCCD